MLMKEEREILKSTQIQICRICASELSSNKECTDPSCKNYEKEDDANLVDIVSYDLISQLKSIIIKNQDLIDNYAGKLHLLIIERTILIFIKIFFREQ